MKKITVLSILIFSLTHVFAQNQKKVNTYFTTQYNHTINDVTLGNNPWGIGIGLQTFLNNKTNFKPTIEITADIYLEDDKVFRTDSSGKELNTIEGMTSIFMGTSFIATNKIYVSVTAGPSFLSGQTLLGIKPSIGFYFSNNKKVTAKISYINIFKRGNIIKENFTSWNVTFGVKLF